MTGLFLLNFSTHKYNKIREVGFRVLGHDFRLVLSPKRGLLHSKFKAVEIVDDQVQKKSFSFKFYN